VPRCGSGAWCVESTHQVHSMDDNKFNRAITAANCFPKAEVVAVDVNPIPLQR